MMTTTRNKISNNNEKNIRIRMENNTRESMLSAKLSHKKMAAKRIEELTWCVCAREMNGEIRDRTAENIIKI